MRIRRRINSLSRFIFTEEAASHVISLTGNPKIAAANNQFANSHGVLRNGARFVGTDDCSRSQSFYSGKFTDNSILPGHALNTQGQDDSNDSRQPFRDSGYGQADGDQEHLVKAASPQHTQQKNNYAEENAQHSQLLAKLAQFFLQGRLLLAGLADQAGNTAYLSSHSRAGDQDFAPAEGNRGAHMYHIVPFGQGSIFHGNKSVVFLHWFGLAGQG